MRDVYSLIWLALIGLFRSRASLQAEILTLRHQLNVLRRKSPQRLTSAASTVWYLPGCIGWHWRAAGRNDPCLCGSGKKFKHCHGALKLLH
jgi:uncharacterized protein YecA (UPF0149 family)